MTDNQPDNASEGLWAAVEALADNYHVRTFSFPEQRPSWSDIEQDLRTALAEHPATPANGETTEAKHALMRLFREAYHTAGTRKGRFNAVQDWHAIHAHLNQPQGETMTTTPNLTCCCVTNPKCPEHSTDVTETPICDCGVSVDEHGGEMDDCPGDQRQPGNPGVGVRPGRYED